MIRTTPQRRFHVSNRAALLAALILVITSYVGFAGNKAFEQKYTEQTVAETATADSQSVSSTSNKRKLSISLLLFGRG